MSPIKGLLIAVVVLAVPGVAQASAPPVCPDGDRCESRYDAPATTPRNGIVLVVHGGGWEAPLDRHPVGRPIEAGLSQVANNPWNAAIRDAGWATRTVTYSGMNCPDDGKTTDWNNCQNSPDDGRDAFKDVRHWLDWQAERAPRAPLCVAGGSAGGQLALLLPASRDPACVISNGGPADLTDSNAPFVTLLAGQAFPSPAGWSPLNWATKFGSTETLLGHARGDKLVPLAQVNALHDALISAGSVSRRAYIGDGTCGFVHDSTASCADFDIYVDKLQALLARAS